MFTKYYRDVVMGNALGTKTDPALPEVYWLGVSATEPDDEGQNVTEPNDELSGYARVKLTSLSEPDGGVISNTAEIAFPLSLTDWGKLTHYVIYDSAEGGNLLIYDTLNRERNIEDDTIMTVRPNELELILRNAAKDEEETE